MDVLDLFLKKYSYKFPKGYPDMNNEQDILLMESILSEFGVSLNEEDKQEDVKHDYDGEILNLLTTLSDEEAKKKVISYLNKINKKEDKDEDKLEKDIEKILKSKKLAFEYIEYIILLANKLDELIPLDEYIHSPTITYEDLKSNNNFNILFKSIPLSDNFKTRLIQKSGRGIGKGEIALITFIKDCEALGGKKGETEGDIKIGSNKIEIKGGMGALVSFDILKYGSKPTSELVKELPNLEVKSGEKWSTTVQKLYNSSDNKSDILIKINKILKDFYSGKINPITDEELKNKNLEDYITDNLAKDYIKDKHIMFINDIGEKYKIIENYEEYEQLRNSNELIIQAFSDKFPRLSYISK
jgi:hypothetical protein